MKYKGLTFPDPVWGNTIEPKEVTWLWYPFIPVGAATMIFGPGGTGKSHIAVDIASRVSRGEAFPGQVGVPLPAQKVLMLSAEDELDRVMVPRLIKAGANLNNIALLAEPITLDKLGLEVIEHFIDQFAVGIVFIDPVVAYIGGKVDINRANETRTFTGGLHRIAMDTGTPIVVVHHARKGSEGADYERMMGSADFSNAVRSVLYTTQAPNGDRIMKHVKANYAPLGSTWRYQFGENGFEWVGTYHEDGTAAQHKGAKRNEASEWIKEILKDGPVRATEIEEKAEYKGYNHRTLVRAKAGIAESYLEANKNGKMQWYWRLINGPEQSDLPIMDNKWGPEKQSRTDREIVARETARNREASGRMASGRSEEPLTVDDLMDTILK